MLITLFTTIKMKAIARKCSELKMSQWIQVEYTEVRETTVWVICLFYFLIDSLISYDKIGNCMWAKNHKTVTVMENQKHYNVVVML